MRVVLRRAASCCVVLLRAASRDSIIDDRPKANPYVRLLRE